MIAIGNAVGDARGVWGVVPFSGCRAHRWAYLPGEERSFSTVQSVCGLTRVVGPRVPLLDAGSFVRCRRCEATR